MHVLAQKLIREITINPINKETSILKLNIKGKTPKKSIKILNNFIKGYECKKVFNALVE